MRRLLGVVYLVELAALAWIAHRILQALEENTDQAARRGALILPALTAQEQLEVDVVRLLDDLSERLLAVRAGAVEAAEREQYGHGDGQPQPPAREERGGHRSDDRDGGGHR